jgi:hypothetical protein
MPLPKHVQENVEQAMTDYCARRVPEHLHDQVRVGFQIRGTSLTLFEERPQFRQPHEWVKLVVAQLRYDERTGEWSLYCADRNSRWHLYDAAPARDIRSLLREVDADPTGIFWG